MSRRTLWSGAMAVLAVVLVATPARATFHFWQFAELFSNADGSVQFVELRNDADFEHFTMFQQIHSKNVGATITNVFSFPSNLPSSDTANTRLLLATPGFAAVAGVTPDFEIPAGFLFTAGGSIEFLNTVWGPLNYGPLPMDGVTSLLADGTPALNSPTNFAGETGTIVPEPATAGILAAIFSVALMGRRRSAK